MFGEVEREGEIRMSSDGIRTATPVAKRDL